MSSIEDQKDPDWTNYIQYAKTLTRDEMIIREKVVAEYLYDFSWRKACLRCGFRQEFVEDVAHRFSSDPYCIWRVKALARERGLNTNVEEKQQQEELERLDILAALKKEAYNYGPGSTHSARVAALTQLAKLHGMEPVKKSQVEVKASGVMISPGIASVDDWEKVAIGAQQKLQTDTMDAIEKGNKNNVH